jgi:hypothetical protein
MTTTPSDSTPGQSGLRRATADDLPAIRAVIDAAYARYLTRMDKPPAPMFRDYGPSVEAGATWVTGSPITAVLTLYPSSREPIADWWAKRRVQAEIVLAVSQARRA